MATSPIPLRSKAGVQRDGTEFGKDYYNDALWCRFQRGLPRKIGGYRATTATLTEVSRGLHSYTADNVSYLHSGSASYLTQILMNSGGSFGGQHDRTPAGFGTDLSRLWQLDTYIDPVGSVGVLLAHAGNNLNDISSTTNSPAYQGDIALTTPLTTWGGVAPSVSGGVLALNPYGVLFGNNGYVWVSKAKDLTTKGLEAWVTGQKIVAAAPLRSSGGPAALLLSLDSVITMSFDPDPTILFDFNTVSGQSSILGAKTLIEYDGIQYWVGVDRFLMFNGVIQEVPNSMNLNFFFDNVNFAARNKCFAFKVPRFGEIWWCFPMGSATECNHAVIYNVREQCWYDTALPGSGRTAGIFANVYAKPFMGDLEPTTDGFTLWQHETGVDQVSGTRTLAVQSYFETAEFSFIDNSQPINKAMEVAIVEPDFVQTGDMTVQVLGRSNARAPIIEGEIKTFPDVATTPDEQIVEFREERRLLSFKFESNVAGGNYEMGQCIAHVGPGSGRIKQ